MKGKRIQDSEIQNDSKHRRQKTRVSWSRETYIYRKQTSRLRKRGTV